MKGAVRHLVRRIRYAVPEQDLAVDFRRLPALPRSGFVMERVEVIAPGRPAPAPVEETSQTLATPEREAVDAQRRSGGSPACRPSPPASVQARR